MDELHLVRCPPAAGNVGKRKRTGLPDHVPDTRWIKNGQKRVSDGTRPKAVLRYSYRCCSPNCPARKVRERNTVLNTEMKVTFYGLHTHTINEASRNQIKDANFCLLYTKGPIPRCPPSFRQLDADQPAACSPAIQTTQKASIAQEVGTGQHYLAAQSGSQGMSQGFCSSEETRDMTNSVEVDWESFIDWGIKFTQISDCVLNLQLHNSAASCPPAAHQGCQRRSAQEKVANSGRNARKGQAEAAVSAIGELADIEIDMDACLRSLTDSLPSTEICPF